MIKDILDFNEKANSDLLYNNLNLDKVIGRIYKFLFKSF